MVIASAAPLPRLALLLCGAALATFVVRSKPGAVEDSDANSSSFLTTLTKLEGELESFMKAQHDEMAPEVTAHEYEEKMAADVEKLEENAPETLSSIADRIDALCVRAARTLACSERHPRACRGRVRQRDDGRPGSRVMRTNAPPFTVTTIWRSFSRRTTRS